MGSLILLLFLERLLKTGIRQAFDYSGTDWPMTVRTAIGHRRSWERLSAAGLRWRDRPANSRLFRESAGLALLIIPLTGNLMGDWLREWLDPRLRHLH